MDRSQRVNGLLAKILQGLMWTDVMLLTAQNSRDQKAEIVGCWFQMTKQI